VLLRDVYALAALCGAVVVAVGPAGVTAGAVVLGRPAGPLSPSRYPDHVRLEQPASGSGRPGP